MSRIDSFMNLSPLKTTALRKVISFSDISAVNFILLSLKEKQRQAPRTPNVVFLVASHYQSFQIMSFALKSMSFRYSGAFTHIVVTTVAVVTTGPAVSTPYASLFSCLKTDNVASCLKR